MKDQAFDLDFDQMVEALEDNEDMVECQECFDLFPKVDCVKQGHAYICPTCRRATSLEPEFDSRMITTDLYNQEFPEVTDYAPDELRDYEKEDTIADAFDMLIKDEYDAIDGYETADEIVQHSDIEADKKDEILDTLDHIKEEEEEHIDELKDVADIEDKESEPLKEACTWVCVFDGEEIGTVEAESEEAALEKMQQEYPEYPYNECDGCFEVFQEADCKVHKAVTHPEDDRFILNEDTEGTPLNEVTGKVQRGWDTLKNKARAGLRKFTKAAINIDDIFSKGYYIHIENVPEDDLVDAQGKPLQDRTTDNLKDAERLAINISKRLPKAQVYLMGEDEGVEIEDRELQKLVVNKHAWKLARYRAGIVNNSAIEAINKRIKELELAGDNIDATSVGTRSSSLDRAKKAAKETLGDKLDSVEYTLESYSAYSASFDSIISDIDNARTEEDLNKLDIETLKEEAEKLLKKKVDGSTGSDDDLNLDDDEDALEAAKAKAKEALGEKQDPAKFTEESYKRYEVNYNKVVDFINSRTTVEAVEKIDVDKYRAQLSKYLRLRPEEETPDLDDESGNELDDAKKAALKAMGDKKKPEPYTEDSYAAYSEKFDRAISYINKQTTVEGIKKYNFEQLRTRYEALLKEKESEEIPDETDDDIDDDIEDTENLDKLKSDLADEILDGMLGKDGYTEDSYNLYEEEINNILESIENAETVEALKALNAKAKAEEAKKLLKTLESDDTSSEEDDDIDDDNETGGKLKRTGKGSPLDSAEFEQARKKAIEAALNMVKANLGTSPELTAGAATTGDLQAWLDKFKSFFGKGGKRRSEFVFEAFKRKLMRECGDKESQSLEESFKALREAWESEPTVTCGWCNEEVPQSDCRKEIDLGWICGHCEEAIKSRGEKLIFEEELATTSSAVSELKDTEKALKSAAAGIKHMTSAMKN